MRGAGGRFSLQFLRIWEGCAGAVTDQVRGGNQAGRAIAGGRGSAAITRLLIEGGPR